MTISTAGMIEAVRAAAAMTKTQEEQDCLNGIANRIEILAAANADMDLQLNSIRSALNIPDAQSVQSGVIDAFARQGTDIAELTEKSNRLRRTAKEHQEENQQLCNQLAELGRQEPIAWRSMRNGPNAYVVTLSKTVADSWVSKNWPIAPLYARPVPQAVSQPSGYDNIKAIELAAEALRDTIKRANRFRYCLGALMNLDDEIASLKKHMVSQPYTVPDERHAYETFIAKRLGDSIDTQRALNGDPENPDYMAWDMIVGWIAWQGRAAMLKSAPVNPMWVGIDCAEGYALVPIEPTPEMIDSAIGCGVTRGMSGYLEVSYSDVYKAMIAAAPQLDRKDGEA